jgi:hypothetical protein
MHRIIQIIIHNITDSDHSKISKLYQVFLDAWWGTRKRTKVFKTGEQDQILFLSFFLGPCIDFLLCLNLISGVCFLSALQGS